MTNGNYCDLAKTINPSKLDVLTPETKRQILEHDEKYVRFCK